MSTAKANEHPNGSKEARTILELFSGSEQIRIPAYQRAYSWEKKHCVQFLEDLIEQQGKHYYLGQILFEKDGNTLFVIDGQQRLTTTILFMSAIAKIFAQGMGSEAQFIRDTYLGDVFKTVDSDQLVFRRITQGQRVLPSDYTETISQRRMIEGFTFFEGQLTKFHEQDADALTRIKDTLERAVITTFHIASKIEATQVFEYQNNRGKELSRFEIIKAYLMHQVYIQSVDPVEANNAIAEIQGAIAMTYRHIEAVEGFFTENELVDNYCDLFFNISGNIENIKNYLNGQPDRTPWIKRFFDNFAELTYSAKTIVKNKDKPEITNLFFVGNEANWKVVLLALFLKGDASGDMFTHILKLLEVLCFKLKLGDYRTDYLPAYSRKYFGSDKSYDVTALYTDIKAAAETGFKWYWNTNDTFKNIIPNYFDNEKYHYSHNIAKFVLWQYENSLRLQNRSGALMDKDLYDIYTIEHIRPQNPATGADTEEFKANFLHLMGNMALLTQSQNSKFLNKSFEEKKTLFQDTALSTYTEIRAKTQWTEAEITERHARIARFAKEYFAT